jgi:hypothetical protein
VPPTPSYRRVTPDGWSRAGASENETTGTSRFRPEPDGHCRGSHCCQAGHSHPGAHNLSPPARRNTPA